MTLPTSLTLREARRDLVALVVQRHGEPLSINGIADHYPSIGMRWGVTLDIAVRDCLDAGLLVMEHGKLHAVPKGEAAA